jgi:hypothetical protein
MGLRPAPPPHATCRLTCKERGHATQEMFFLRSQALLLKLWLSAAAGPFRWAGPATLGNVYRYTATESPEFATESGCGMALVS